MEDEIVRVVVTVEASHPKLKDPAVERQVEFIGDKVRELMPSWIEEYKQHIGLSSGDGPEQQA